MELNKFIVEKIRVNYASGLYHKADLAMDFIGYLDNITDIDKILNYNIYPELREDLRMKIYGVNYILALADEYHSRLTRDAQEDYIDGLKGVPINIPLSHKQQEAEKEMAKKLKIINREFGTGFTVYDIKSRIYRA